ncbi:MAG: hypothetical protein A2475_03950 [Ignavibacteria bacterium RIFOXYC2_FULL_35_21]|nr:MAG: hypothetical protein A2220_03020 [Ignavibacteria bacterium RIFOXYA2_FULL_35_10]OGV21716.1 MAG: hypothetical protein A2475_03950 [Ignavibacteria bacterium RIFOXYC2_FULL_35_21]
MEYQNLYYTDNHEHAAFLLASNQIIESFYWSKGSAVFVFENEVECERIIKGILKGNIKLTPQSLLEALKTVNGIINFNFFN